VLGGWYVDGEFRALPRSSRLMVLAVLRTGEPSGARELDLIALNRLARAAIAIGRYGFVLPVAMTVVATVYVVLPVVAAFRSGPWCLVCLLPAPLLAPELDAAWRAVDPTGRWDRRLHKLAKPH